MKSQHISIAGAGIGGLSCALFLARAGQQVSLLEQAPALSEAGAGIQLGPNALRVLDALGLHDTVLQTACQPLAIQIRNASTGGSINRMLLGAAVQTRYGQTYCTIHRADLQAALLQAVHAEPLIDLHLNTAIAHYTVNAQGLHIQLQGGQPMHKTVFPKTTLKTNALIGADGLWSQVRTQLLADGAPRATGHAAFRALIPAALMPDNLRKNEITVWWGRGVHVVCYPVRRATCWNVAILSERLRQHQPAEQEKTVLQGWCLNASTQDTQQALGECCEELIALVRAAPAWQRWNLFDRPEVTRWAAPDPQNPVSLLGDAAHPMLPYLAQGAAMALEDAACLARYVQTANTLPQALRSYEQTRQPRTQRVVGTALRNGRIFHLTGAAAIARNTVLALQGTRTLGMSWLYGHDATK